MNALSQRDQRGSGSNSISLLLLMPVILIFIFGAMQTGLYYHGKQVASAAAAAAAEVSRAATSPPGAGESAALQIAKQGQLSDVKVTVTRTATTVTVTVTGKPVTVIDLWPATVTAVVAMPRERTTDP